MITVDLETNLSHDTIWCAGVQKTESPNGSLTFDSAELKQMLSTADGVVGHNIIFFDKPVLKTCWQVDVDVPVWDTLVMARLLDPTPVGGHSLKEWGKRIGIAKMDFDLIIIDEANAIKNIKSSPYKIYPNPSDGIFYIEGAQEPFNYKVYNTKGELVKSSNENYTKSKKALESSLG